MQTNDQYLQNIADKNPELAHNLMDTLGYTNSPNKNNGSVNPNANYFTEPGTAPSTISPPSVPSTMDASSIQQSNPLNLSSTPKDNTDYQSTMSGISDYKDLIKSINEPAPAETTQQDSRNRLQKLMDSIIGKGGSVSSSGDINTDTAKSNATEQYIQGFGYANKADATTQLRDVTSRINALKKETLAVPLQEDLAARGLRGTQGLQDQTNVRLRENTIKSLGLASIAETIQGNLSTAADLANEAVTKEFAPIQTRLNAEMFNYNMNKDELARSDKKKADALQIQLQERQRLLENQKEDKKTIYGLTAEAAKNGAPALLLTRAQQSNNPQEVLQILSQYMSDPTAKAQALANLSKTRAETAKINSEAKANGLQPVTNTDAGKYAGALSVILGSTKLTKEQKNAVINGVNNGSDPVAVIKNQAKDIMGTSEATKVTGYETAKSQLADIQSALTKFYTAGGKTGYLTGNYEKVINKLGEINDPKLVDLGVQIQSALQIYRNAVSGTAYSVQEGADIASIFPGISNTEGLNMARLKGRLTAFDSTIDGAYRTALGSTYDSLKNNQTILPPAGTKGNLPDGTEVTLGADGSITDAKGNKYDANGNKIK